MTQMAGNITENAEMKLKAAKENENLRILLRSIG